MINETQVIISKAYLDELEKFRDSFNVKDVNNTSLHIWDIIKLQIAKEHIIKFLTNTWASLYHEKALDRTGRAEEYNFAMDTIAKMKITIEKISQVREAYDAKKKEKEEKEEEESL